MALRTFNLSVAYRIVGGFSLLVLLMLFSTVLAVWNFLQVDRQITTASEKIYPIQSQSNEIFVSILSANKAANQRLLSDDQEVMDSRESEFLAQRATYQNARKELQALLIGIEEIDAIVSDLDQLAEQFFHTAEQGFEIHNQSVVLGKQLAVLKTDFHHEMNFLQEDLNELSANFDSISSEAYGAMLKEQYRTVAEEFNVALSTRVPEKVRGIQQSLLLRGYGLRVMEDVVSKLQASHPGAGDGIAETLVLLKEAANGPDGVLQAQYHLTNSLRARMDTQENLSSAINSVTSVLSELSIESSYLAQHMEDESRALIVSSQQQGGGFGIAALIIAIITALSVWLSIKRPLNKVMPVLRALADGDMTSRVKHQGNDEFGQLAGWVNALADKLEKAICEIKVTAQNITNAAQSGSQISKRSMSMIERQKQETYVVATSMSQMAEAVKEVAYSADCAQQEIEHINSRAQDNRKLMTANVKTVNSVAQEISNACEVISELKDETNNIGHILEVIKGIAEQTNLLALNAAIEAARAGEQGRGFAVVADEVRTLASRTQSSVQDIHSMIDKLQTGARNAAEIMAISQDKVFVSVSQAEQAGSSLSEIVDRLGEIRSMSTQIAAAAEEQTAVCCGISEGVESIKNIAEGNAVEAQNGARESTSLAVLADQHLSLSSQFRLG